MNLLKRIFVKVGILPFLLIILFILFSIAESRFISISNILNVSRQATYLAIVTTAQMMTILCAGFDLSVGSSVALTGIAASMVMVSIQDPILAITLGILTGIGVAAFIGLINGITIALFGVSPFVVTLGMMSVAHGFALLISGGAPIFNLPSQLNQTLGIGKIGGIPIPLLMACCIIAIIYIMLSKTRVGRYFYAIGGNKEAARLSGIPVKKYTCLAYVLCGILTGIAGIMLTARVASGEPNLGSAFPLESIAAAVIGGVSLRGGEGNLIGAIFGAVLIVLIRNGMDLINISSYLQMVVMGALLIFAVVMDRLRLSIKSV
ncbi:MAG: ABC transporter permease [Deltaproteobacteria bacterium]|nr:ABC transporter permease [Deltaproteobacteria bacterium]